MAQLINVTVVAPKPSFLKVVGAASLNVENIQAIETRTANTESAGVTKILYKFSTSNHFKTEAVFVSDVRTALVTAANLNPAT